MSLRKLTFGLLVLFLFGSFQFVNAQGQVLGRYFKDEQRAKLVLGQPFLAGTRVGDKTHLSEKQAIEMALANNLEINIERQTVIGGRWRVNQLEGFYDPRTTMALNWDRQKTPAASVLEGGTSVTNVLTSVSTGYAQTWSTGTTLEANFAGVRNRTTNFFSSLVPAINTQVDVTFRQALLRGFGRASQEYLIEISRRNVDISEQEFRRRASELILQVQDRYWELEHALGDVQVREKSLQLAQTVLAQNRERFAVGSAARLQVVESESEAALRQEELIRSRYSYRLVQDQLIRLITNYEDPRQFAGDVVPADPASIPNLPVDSFEELQRAAIASRPETQQAELQIAAERINLDQTRDRLRPNLELVAGYQQFGLGGTLINRDFSRGFLNPPVIGIVPGGLGDALDQMFTGGYYGYMLGLTLQLPVFNREARAENAQAQIAVDQAQLRNQAARQTIGLEIREALTQIEMNRARLEAVSTAVRAAEERLVAEQARFDAGMATTRELIEAQRDLLQAQTVRLRAQIDLIKNYALLDRATGRTFERQNIRLVDALAINVK